MPDRLKQGFVLFPGATGRWCLHGPGDRLIRLREEPDLIGRLAQHLASSSDSVPPQDLRDVLSAFEAYGLLETSAPSQMPLPGRRVAVAGNGVIVTKLQNLLMEAGIGSVTILGDSWPPAVEFDLLIACAGWLPDAPWRLLDVWCAERDIPWHRVYQEGAALHFGPFSIPGATASYTDSRDRRLAAAPFPEELEALWHHLNGGCELPPPPLLSAAVAAIAAAFLAEDVLAFLCGRSVPSLGYTLELSLSNLAVSRHPMLPVPRGLLTDDA